MDTGVPRTQGVGKVVNRALDLVRCAVETRQSGATRHRVADRGTARTGGTWPGGERSPCRHGATEKAQGPDPGRCVPSPQVKAHILDFADPLARTPAQWRALIKEASFPNTYVRQD